MLPAICTVNHPGSTTRSIYWFHKASSSGEMLGCGQDVTAIEALLTLTLKPLNHGHAHSCGEMWILAEGFLDTTEAAVPGNIQTGRVTMMTVQCPGLPCDRIPHAFDQTRVERASHGNRLWKDRGARSCIAVRIGFDISRSPHDSVKDFSLAHTGNAESFVCRSVVAQFMRFLFERHSRNEVTDSVVHRPSMEVIPRFGGIQR